MAGFFKVTQSVATQGAPANPSANNLQSWTFDPFFANNADTLPTGVGYFGAFLPTTTVSLNSSNKFWIYTGSVPTSQTYGAIGIYNAAGVLLAISSSTNIFSVAGATSVTFASSVQLNAGTTYYFGILGVYTVGTLSLWGFSSSDPAGLDNVNISTPAAGNLGFRSQSISGLSTLPATLPATVPTAQSSYVWVGIQ